MQDSDPIGNGGQSRRQRDPAQETALAQLLKNAHDAGDTDAMRSLGRELQRRGWEYGETVPGWPYIKPPARFQATPGVDATASLREVATQQPSVPVPNRGEQALIGFGGSMIKSAGETLAGIPKAIADLPFSQFEPVDWAVNKITPLVSRISPEIAGGIDAVNAEHERAKAIIRKPIEQNVVGRALTRAGESLIGTG